MTHHYKEHIFCIFLLSIFAYTGMYFAELHFPISVDKSSYFIIVAHALLTINSLVIYQGIRLFNGKNTHAFLIACLYLVNPTHFDMFLMQNQLQVLLGELGLLVFFIFYFRSEYKKALFCILMSVLLNTKLIFILPLIIVSKKFNLKQKIYAGLTFIFLLIQLYPLFQEQKIELLQSVKTIFYLLEVQLVPWNISFMNFSFIIPGYYPISFLVSALLLWIVFATTVLIKKNEFALKIFLLLSIAFSGSLTPLKQIYHSVDNAYYLFPSFYPTTLLCLLFLIYKLIVKYDSRSLRASLSFLALFWLICNLGFQANSQGLLQSWENSIKYLPRHYNSEEKIKLKYAQVLMMKNQLKKAKEVVNQAKRDFPSEYWYGMLLSIANEEKDTMAVKLIYQEMSDQKIPFLNPEE